MRNINSRVQIFTYEKPLSTFFSVETHTRQWKRAQFFMTYYFAIILSIGDHDYLYIFSYDNHTQSSTFVFRHRFFHPRNQTIAISHFSATFFRTAGRTRIDNLYTPSSEIIQKNCSFIQFFYRIRPSEHWVVFSMDVCSRLLIIFALFCAMWDLRNTHYAKTHRCVSYHLETSNTSNYRV